MIGQLAAASGGVRRRHAAARRAGGGTGSHVVRGAVSERVFCAAVKLVRSVAAASETACSEAAAAHRQRAQYGTRAGDA